MPPRGRPAGGAPSPLSLPAPFPEVPSAPPADAPTVVLMCTRGIPGARGAQPAAPARGAPRCPRPGAAIPVAAAADDVEAAAAVAAPLATTATAARAAAAPARCLRTQDVLASKAVSDT